MAKTLKLSRNEMHLLKAIRGLRAEETRRARPHARLLEHGTVSVAEAAALLGRTVADVTAALGVELPRAVAGRVPLSELRRVVELQNARALSTAHAHVAGLFRPKGAFSWFAVSLSNGRRSVARAAEQLRLSQREVMRLVDAGVLFATRRGPRRAITISREELEAYSASLRHRPLALFSKAPESGPIIRSRAERQAARSAA